MSARADYIAGADSYDPMCDEIDRLRAQIERDRPVIEACLAEVEAERVLLRTKAAWWMESTDDARTALATAQLARVEAVDAYAASAPDEVNEAET